VGPRVGLDHVEKNKFLTLLGLELGPLSRRARSQSLYRLRYPGSKYDELKMFSVKFCVPTSSNFNNSSNTAMEDIRFLC
jgi:hypothetical protein